MGWRRRQAHNEMVVVKKCRYCKGSGRKSRQLCQSCHGSGQAKTVYWLFMGGARRG